MATNTGQDDDLVRKLDTLKIAPGSPPGRRGAKTVVAAAAVVLIAGGLLAARYGADLLPAVTGGGTAALPSAAGQARATPDALDRTAREPVVASRTRLSVPGLQGVVGSGYAVSAKKVTVIAEVTGVVESVLVAEGDRVEAGQLLGKLKDSLAAEDYAISASKVAQAEASVKVARAVLDEARDPLERLAKLKQRGVVSEIAVSDAQFLADQKTAQLALEEARAETSRREAERARLVVEQHEVRAPFAGIVAELLVVPGETTLSASDSGRPGQGIAVLFDPDDLQVEMEVSENSVGQIRRGQRAEATFSALPGDRFAMTVRAIRPISSRERGTVTVQLVFDEPPRNILPEMAAKVTVNTAQKLAAHAGTDR